MTDLIFVNNGEFQGSVAKKFEVVPYFQAHELACPKARIVQFESIFLSFLVVLRVTVDHVLSINSASRTPSYNNILECAHPHSLHQTLNPHHKNIHTGQALKSCAVDVNTRGWSDSKIKKFVSEAEKLGLSVGVARTFIHIDGRFLAGLPQHRFYYGSAKQWFVNILN